MDHGYGKPNALSFLPQAAGLGHQPSDAPGTRQLALARGTKLLRWSIHSVGGASSLHLDSGSRQQAAGETFLLKPFQAGADFGGNRFPLCGSIAGTFKNQLPCFVPSPHLLGGADRGEFHFAGTITEGDTRSVREGEEIRLGASRHVSQLMVHSLESSGIIPERANDRRQHFLRKGG